MKSKSTPYGERSRSTLKTCPPPSSVSQSICQIRVLIADDQEIVRVGLRTMCKNEPDLLIVAETGSLTDTVPEAQRVQPDIVLLQYRFSEGPGSEFCRTLIEINPKARVIILSLDNTRAAFSGAMEAGADGYLLLGANRQELLRAIRAVAAGASYVDMAVLPHLFAALRRGQDALPFRRPEFPHMSPQQQQILPLLSEGKTNKEIARQLSLSDKTVKNYLANIFKKLGVTTRARAAALFVLNQQGTSSAIKQPSALSMNGNS
ncbi:MAG: response regulator transcription factor [Nitrospira sp. CG24E]|nr:MAG: response regulator transcription factor [Nitrospira sp. CG24E]